MTTKDVWKSIGVLGALMVLCAALFSVTPLSLFSGSFWQLLGSWLTVLAAAGLYGAYISSLRKKQRRTVSQAQMDLKELQKTIDRTPPKAFKKEMRTLEAQADRMQTKRETLDASLRSYFGDSRISLEKFLRTIDAVQGLFLDNSQKILSRISLFDEAGYRDLFAKHLEYTSAIVPYNEHFAYVSRKLDENEKILQKMDRLLLEVTGLNESQVPIDQLPAMQEINELIEQTRLYRQN